MCFCVWKSSSESIIMRQVICVLFGNTVISHCAEYVGLPTKEDLCTVALFIPIFAGNYKKDYFEEIENLN